MGGDAAQLAIEVTSGWPAAVAGEEGPAQALVDEALAARPELASARLAIAAAEASARASAVGLRPSLSASAQAGVGTRDFEQFGPAWTATIKFAWPLYDGGATAAAIDEARAEAEASQRELEQAVLDVRSEVVQALLAIRQAKAAGLAARAAAEAAEAELTLADARYKQGLDSGIERADVQAQVVQTQAEIITADWTLAVGRAQLLHALGRAGAP
jgi:outer membrane protein TolC